MQEKKETKKFDRETLILKAQAEFQKRKRLKRLSNGAYIDRFGRDRS